MDWIEELKATYKKLKQCEAHALLRFMACKSDCAARWATPLLLDGHGSEFYAGEHVAYRNSAHYIENLLKVAGIDPTSIPIDPPERFTTILASQKRA